MGVLDRIRSILGGSRDGETGDYPADRPAGGGPAAGDDPPGIDRGAGTAREGAADDDRKAGAHGAHWDAVLGDDELVREAIVEAARAGETVPRRAVEGQGVTGRLHPAGNPVRTCAVTTDGTLTTAYPVGNGIAHEVTVTEVVEWANGVEAQVAFDLSGRRAAAFDAGYFRPIDYGPGDAVRMELSGFAYELAPAGGEAAVTEGEVPEEGEAAFVGFDGGDVDDYLVRGRVGEVRQGTYRGRDVYGLRLSIPEGGEVAVYAADHVLEGYVPEPGDEVEGVLWLQGWIRDGGA